jgi:[lysine-biosynthesis-protein LysW]--L-2-aminoadipate ligase
VIGILCGRVRFEEKALFDALRRRGIDFERLDEEKLQLPIGGPPPPFDVVLDRSIHHGRSLYTLTLLNASGVPTVNSARVAQICGDKIFTSAALGAAGLPVPKTVVTFTREAALDAIEAMGYPVVLKPMVGSWGRLLAKINDRDAAEAVLEHKETLGSYHHGIFYIQDYISKPQRDIRAIVVGRQTIGAIYRSAEHWITNTARAGQATPCPVTPEIDRLCQGAAAAVGGGFLAIDLLEHDGGLLVNEINYTPEYHGFAGATGIAVADLVIDYLLEVGGIAADGKMSAQKSRGLAAVEEVS